MTLCNEPLKNPFALFTRLRAVPDLEAFSDDQLLDMFAVHSVKEAGSSVADSIRRRVLSKALAALGFRIPENAIEDRRKERARERREGRGEGERKSREVEFHAQFLKLVIKQLEKLEYIPLAFPINLHSKQDFVHTLNYLVDRFENERRKKQADENKEVFGTTSLRKTPKRKVLTEKVLMRSQTSSFDSVTASLSRRAMLPTKLKSLPSNLTHGHRGTSATIQRDGEVDDDLLPVPTSMTTLARSTTSPDLKKIGGKFNGQLECQEETIRQLRSHNEHLSSELCEITSLYEHLVGERKQEESLSGDQRLAEGEPDPRRIALLQSLNLQLERQVSIQTDSTTSRAALVDDIDAGLSNALNSLQQYERTLPSPVPQLSTIFTSLHDLRGRLRHQMPIWNPGGIMAGPPYGGDDGDAASFSRPVRFMGLFVDPKLRSRRKVSLKSEDPGMTFGGRRNNRVGKTSHTKTDIHDTKPISDERHREIDGNENAESENGLALGDRDCGSKNKKCVALVDRDRGGDSERAEGGRSLALADICSGDIGHLNLRQISILESRLRSLYADLRSLSSCLKTVPLSAEFTAPGSRISRRPDDEDSRRPLLDHVLTQLQRVESSTVSVADLIFRLAVLVPASPFFSCTRNENNLANHSAPSSSSVTLELPTVEDLSRQLQLVSSQRRQAEVVVGRMLHGWQCYQDMYRKEIDRHHSELQSLKEVYASIEKQVQKRIDRLDGSRNDFECNVKSLADTLEGYLKHLTTDDSYDEKRADCFLLRLRIVLQEAVERLRKENDAKIY